MRIVVADDNVDILNLVSKRLTRRGFEVETAADGQEALDLVRGSMPDAVVLDWVMPVIQGHEVCAQLKAQQATSEIPIVMLTARASDDDVNLGMQLGADAYMTKPFEIDELAETIRQLVERAGR